MKIGFCRPMSPTVTSMIGGRPPQLMIGHHHSSSLMMIVSAHRSPPQLVALMIASARRTHCLSSDLAAILESTTVISPPALSHPEQSSTHDEVARFRPLSRQKKYSLFNIPRSSARLGTYHLALSSSSRVAELMKKIYGSTC